MDIDTSDSLKGVGREEKKVNSSCTRESFFEKIKEHISTWYGIPGETSDFITFCFWSEFLLPTSYFKLLTSNFLLPNSYF